MFHQCPDILSVKDLRCVLRIGRAKAYELVNSKQIASIKVGKKILVPKKSLLDYVNRMGYNSSRVDSCLNTKEDL